MGLSIVRAKRALLTCCQKKVPLCCQKSPLCCQKGSTHVLPKKVLLCCQKILLCCPKMLLFLILASGASADCGFKGSCSQDGLYPCPDDCSMFAQCGSGILYEKDCPEHTYFNPSGPDTGICDYHCPWTNPPETTTASTPSPPIECYDRECSPEGYSPVQIYPCNRFYICQDGHQCLYECPEDLIFDPNDNLCKVKGEGPECINTGNKDPLRPFKPASKAINLS